MFCKDGFDFFVGGESAFPCGLQAAIDAFEFLRSGLVSPTPEARIDFERNFGELLLSFFRQASARCIASLSALDAMI
jgi:hypothetical protein